MFLINRTKSHFSGKKWRAGLLISGLVLSFFINLTIQPAPFLKIYNYKNKINQRFIKKRRKSTGYIIIHTSEAGINSTLRTVLKGKRISKRYRTHGGHTHYVISRKGKTYQILHTKFRADHTGRSMWNGITDLSSHSIGIELVGYHYGKITGHQYNSLKKLLKKLQHKFEIPDKNILTHSQISYGNPNRWYRKPHRGRKKCGLNFSRQKAGLKEAWTYDPDVRARRLLQDPAIAKVFYIKAFRKTHPSSIPGGGKKTTPLISNIITRKQTAWSIAGEDYDNPGTVYKLPDGKKLRGNKIEKLIGWNNIPPQTEVLLNQPTAVTDNPGPVYTITQDQTVFNIAGKEYLKATTFFLLHDFQLIRGIYVDDWDSIPPNTKMIVNYLGPFIIENKQGKTPWGIARNLYNHKNTLYLIPEKGFVRGNKILDFSNLPKGSKIFLRKK